MAIFLLYGIIALFWTLYRAFFHLPETWDEFVFKPLIFLIPVFLWVKLGERQNLASLGISGSNLARNLLIGLLLGLFFAGEGVVTMALKYKEVIFNPNHLGVEGIILAGFVSLATGLSEEVLNRGFLMNRLWSLWHSETLANLVSNVCFVLMHLPAAIFVLKLNTTYDFLTYGLSIFILGIADGYVFGRTKTVLAPTISHAIWNWSTILFK